MPTSAPRSHEQLAEALYALHDDIRSLVVVNLVTGELVYRHSRAKQQLPERELQKSAIYRLRLDFGLHDTFQDYFGPFEWMVSAFARAQILRFRVRDQAIVLTARKGMPLDVVEKAAATCRAWFR